ncbi:MAG: N-acetylglucosamine-6-phosphate deacetylase [Caldilineaceae bacterium]
MSQQSQCEPLPSRFALTNGRIVLPDKVLSGEALLIEDGKIAAIVDTSPENIAQIDVGGRLIAPGLVDIHIHGAEGYTFNEPTELAFARITQALVRRGITSLLATTLTDALDTLCSVFAFTRQWMQKQEDAVPQGAQVLGLHVEGPYFNRAQAGAQDPAHICNPDDGSTEQLLAYADLMRIFTFAPELPGALALTRRIAELGIVPAAGHSAAREQDVKPAINLGLRHMIHLWSAQSTTIREGAWRKPGLLEVSLTDERLTGEIIADGKHLPPTLMKLAYRCLGADRLCAISDATSGAGLPEGSHFRLAGLTCEVHDGVGMLLDRTAFAGSTTLLNQMLPILIEQVGIPLPEAVRMASLTPARVIGVANRKGSLEIGKDADIAIFNDDFSPWRVFVRGEAVGQ